MLKIKSRYGNTSCGFLQLQQNALQELALISGFGKLLMRNVKLIIPNVVIPV